MGPYMAVDLAATVRLVVRLFAVATQLARVSGAGVINRSRRLQLVLQLLTNLIGEGTINATNKWPRGLGIAPPSQPVPS